MAFKALSIRQPWAWAILHAGKSIENRDWRSSYRGPVLIHAAKGMTKDEYQSAIAFISRIKGELTLPDFELLHRGAIVGAVDIVDCVTESDSPWFQGKYGFVLQNPRPIKEPVSCKGALKFWEVPPEIEQEIRRQYATKEAA